MKPLTATARALTQAQARRTAKRKAVAKKRARKEIERVMTKLLSILSSQRLSARQVNQGRSRQLSIRATEKRLQRR